MDSGFDLTVRRQLTSPQQDAFGGFLDYYGEDRPDWIVAARLDPRVGGRWTITFEPPGLPRFEERRVIRRLERPRLIEYTVEIEPSDDRSAFSTDVTISFDANDDGTLLSLAQRGFPTGDSRDDFAAAWRQVLDLIAHRIDGA
jgi:uncharacterized protein YndB with AHSA1/START domain